MKKEKNRKGKITENLKNILNSNQGLLEQAERVEKETIDLQNDIEFYKASIRGAEALISTMELMKNGKGISISNLSDILTATLIMFEDQGLIKIIRKK